MSIRQLVPLVLAAAGGAVYDPSDLGGVSHDLTRVGYVSSGARRKGGRKSNRQKARKAERQARQRGRR